MSLIRGANRIAKSQLKLAQVQALRQEAESQSTLQVKYVELFYNEITSQNHEKQTSALSLLNLMNPDLANKLTTWIDSNPKLNLSSELKLDAKAIGRDAALRVLNSYVLGIYFPNASQELSKVANDIHNKLIQYGFRKEQIKLYRKHATFFENAVPPKGYEIRYEPGFEDDAANVLENVLKEIYPLTTFRQEVVEAGRTANFISLFLGIEH